MKRRLSILIAAGAFLLLAVYGAGIFPWTVIAATVALCLAQQPWRGQRPVSPAEAAERGTQAAERNDARHPPPGKATCRPLAPRARLLPVWRFLSRSPFALLLLYLLLMLVPLPALVSQAGDGVRAQQNRLVAETLEAATAAGVEHGVSPVFSITRSRAGTLRFLLLVVLAYSGWRLAASASVPRRIAGLRVMVLIGSMMAIAGILGKWVMPQGDTLWWWIPIPHGRPGPMGGFMNRNHFAGFCAILAPAALALVARDVTRRRPAAALLNAATALALIAGVLLSLSRGGLIALVAGLVTLTLIGLWHGSPRSRIVLIAVALGLTTLILAVAWQQDAIRERLSSLRDPLATQSARDRLAAWRTTLRIWRQYPLLGAGPNAFRVAYPRHRTTSAREARDFAGNEYVQWAGETGLAGGLVALLLIGLMVRDACRALRAGVPGARTLSAAAIAALATAAVHALVDFPLHLPLYALTVAALAGMLRGKTDATFPTLACLVIALSLGAFDLQLDMGGRIIRAGISDTARALAAAPTSPVAWRRLSALLWVRDTPSTRALAERCLTQAAVYDPNNYPLWIRLGDQRRELGNNRGAMEAYRRVKQLRDWVDVPTSLPEEN